MRKKKKKSDKSIDNLKRKGIIDIRKIKKKSYKKYNEMICDVKKNS